MTEHRRFYCPNSKFTKFSVCSFAALLVVSGGLILVPVNAKAQSGPITVDLSVIGDGGVSGFGGQSPAGLLVPPPTNPVSELHIAPQNPPALKAPIARPMASVKRPSTDPKAKSVAMAKKPAAAKKAKAKSAQTAVALAPTPKPVPVTKVEKVVKPPVPAQVAVKKDDPAPAPMAAAPAVSNAPPPPPQVAVAAEPKVSDEQASTATQAIDVTPGQALRIEFSETETKLPDSLKEALRKVADGVHDKQDLRLQLMAYAGAEGLSASKARRLSLSRALSVRSFLIESGVRSTRIDVRALGNKTSDEPANRVDVNIAKR